jgi:hypothetical protein
VGFIMREINGYVLGHQILAGVEVRDRRPRGGGRKIVVTEDGRRLPYSLLPIELAILERASLSGEANGDAREITPNMMLDELESSGDRRMRRLNYEQVKNALKRLDSWGYMSARVIGREGIKSAHKAYSITQEGLIRIKN